jgi:cytochrome P450
MTETEGYVDQAVAGLAEPQPMYKALRESAPVFRSPQDVVVLSRLADIEMALKHTELFSSNMDAVDLGNIRPMIPLQVDPPTRSTVASSIRCSLRARWPAVNHRSPSW